MGTLQKRKVVWIGHAQSVVLLFFDGVRRVSGILSEAFLMSPNQPGSKRKNSFFRLRRWAIATIADEATATARDIFLIVGRDRQRVLAAQSSSVMAARLFEMLPEHPIVTIAKATHLLDTTKPTATKAVTALVDAGVLVETSGRKRDWTFCYKAYLDILCAGTELDQSKEDEF